MDAIGDTAYSERFVLRTLLGLQSEEEPSSEFVEKDLCTLWDMSAEKDVSLFLARAEKGGFEALCWAASRRSGGRVAEIAAGILANVCCRGATEAQIREACRSVLPLAGSDDPATLAQAMRFAHSIVYGAENADERLQLLEEADFASHLAFAMENCLDETALIGCFETLNCICSAGKDGAERRFRRLFVNEEIASGALAAYAELSRMRERAPDSDADVDERCQFLFLASTSALLDAAPEPDDLYGDRIDLLLRFVREILTEGVDNRREATEDIVEYVVSIISALNCPRGEIAENILTAMLKLWTITCNANRGKVNGAAPDAETVKFDIRTVNSALVNYFVRIVKLWPQDELGSRLKNIGNEQIVHLISDVKDALKDNKIEEYYGDVPSILEQFVLGELAPNE